MSVTLLSVDGTFVPRRMLSYMALPRVKLSYMLFSFISITVVLSKEKEIAFFSSLRLSLIVVLSLLPCKLGRGPP